MSFTTLIYSRLFGKLVGMDEHGNNYYRAKERLKNGRERRWVLYKGEPEASLIPPEWHGWLHHTIDEPLSENGVQQAEWQLEHIPNLTGTTKAYRPKNYISEGNTLDASSQDYKAWIPK